MFSHCLEQFKGQHFQQLHIMCEFVHNLETRSVRGVNVCSQHVTNLINNCHLPESM